MLEISKIFSWKVRKKRALEMKTQKQCALEIGISRTTLRNVEMGKVSKLSKPVYQKIVNWLLMEID